MRAPTVLDLFAGIGGFSLGLERAGFKTIAFCEINQYCQQVLSARWPGVVIYDDVREISAAQLVSDGIERPAVITGGFPCQDISTANSQRREGIEGERSGLWAEFARIIGDLRPDFAIVENVPALLSGARGRWFGCVLGDLAEIGYDCEWHCIPASAIGAPHWRDRVWVIAYPARERCRETRQDSQHSAQRAVGRRTVLADAPGVEGNGRRDHRGQTGRTARRQPPGEFSRSGDMADTASIGRNQMVRSAEVRAAREGAISSSADGGQSAGRPWWATEPDVGRVADGVPARVDRLRCLGNAIVPQIAELIGGQLLSYYKE